MKKIKLFSSCIIVRGANRSIICDLQRNSFTFIPNDLYDILELNQGYSLDEIKKKYDNKFHNIIDEYFEFLFEKEFIFTTDYPSLFPMMDLKWFDPFEVTNAIIDINNHDFKHEKTLLELDKLKCKFVEFRIYKFELFNLIKNILTFINENNLILISIGIIIPYSDSTKILEIKKLVENHPRIAYFIITNSTENKLVESENKKLGNIFFSTNKIDTELHCGKINGKNFVVNTKQFSESQNNNTCLNRKISIDKDGNIKNCPSMLESFGNIKNTTLEAALNHPNFKKYWNINKDQIEVCKDCEFRHICTDCRAYLEEPENIYSKPLKCGYNPYTNQWFEWSTNPLKDKAIEYYAMQDLVKKDV